MTYYTSNENEAYKVKLRNAGYSNEKELMETPTHKLQEKVSQVQIRDANQSLYEKAEAYRQANTDLQFYNENQSLKNATADAKIGINNEFKETIHTTAKVIGSAAIAGLTGGLASGAAFGSSAFFKAFASTAGESVVSSITGINVLGIRRNLAQINGNRILSQPKPLTNEFGDVGSNYQQYILENDMADNDESRTLYRKYKKIFKKGGI